MKWVSREKSRNTELPSHSAPELASRDRPSTLKSALYLTLPGRLRSCGRYPLLVERQMALKVIVEGRMGTTLSEGVLLRMVMKAVLMTINTTRAMAQNAIVLHDFGLPTIMAAVQMRIGRLPVTN